MTMNVQYAACSYRKVCGVLQSKEVSLNSCYFSYIVFTEKSPFVHNSEKNYRV